MKKIRISDPIENTLAVTALCNTLKEVTGRRFSVNNPDTAELVEKWLICGFGDVHFGLVARWAAKNHGRHDLAERLSPHYLLNAMFEERFNIADAANQREQKRKSADLERAQRKELEAQELARAWDFHSDLLEGKITVPQEVVVAWNQALGYHPSHPLYVRFTKGSMPFVHCVSFNDPDIDAKRFLGDLETFSEVCGSDFYKLSISETTGEKLTKEREIYPGLWGDLK